MIKNHHEFILHATEVVKGCAVFDVHVCSAGGIVLKSLHSAFLHLEPGTGTPCAQKDEACDVLCCLGIFLLDNARYVLVLCVQLSLWRVYLCLVRDLLVACLIPHTFF